MPQLYDRSRKLQHLRLLTADDLFTRLLVCHHRKHAKPIDQLRGRPRFVPETLRIRSKLRSQLSEYGFLQGKDESGSFLRSEPLGCARSRNRFEEASEWSGTGRIQIQCVAAHRVTQKFMNFTCLTLQLFETKFSFRRQSLTKLRDPIF